MMCQPALPRTRNQTGHHAAEKVPADPTGPIEDNGHRAKNTAGRVGISTPRDAQRPAGTRWAVGSRIT